MDMGAIVMAAGLGTRMKSKTVKVLHPLCGKPMLSYVLDLLVQAKVKKAAIVVSHQKEKVIEFVRLQYPKAPFIFVDQKKPLGTGDAVLKTEKVFKGVKFPVLILSGDVPGLTLETLKLLVQNHVKNNRDLTLTSAILDETIPYGRVIRNHNRVEKIVEAEDAKPQELKVLEMNMGLYCVNPAVLFSSLKKITSNNAKKEYYLTDIISLIENKQAFLVQDKEEVLGINDRYDLSLKERFLRDRINKEWMIKGVTILDPHTTWIDPDVILAPDVTLFPQVSLQGKTRIETDVVIGTGSIIRHSLIKKETVVKEYSVVEESKVDEKVIIGPFARIRPGTHMKKGSRIGNFVELKKTTFGENSKANHLTYLGDAVIGKDVNIGCGVITCNYDGGLRYKGKAKTTIGDHVFVGSDCQLVAPVTLKKGAYIASGTTLTQNVPEDSLVIARAPQVIKKGYMKKMWARKKR